MTRESTNEHGPDGRVLNGFDYELQLWVENGIVQNCGHPAVMNCSCLARKYHGKTLAEAYAGEQPALELAAETAVAPRGAAALSASAATLGPRCGHSACSQHYIDTGKTFCVCDANGDPLIGSATVRLLFRFERLDGMTTVVAIEPIRDDTIVYLMNDDNIERARWSESLMAQALLAAHQGSAS